MPETHESSDAGTPPNAGTGEHSATSQNTGNGQGGQPSSAPKTATPRNPQDVSFGLGLGEKRAAKRLAKMLDLETEGEPDLDTLLDALAAQRHSKPEPAATKKEEAAAPPATDIADHPEVKKLAAERTRSDKRVRELEREVQRLQGQADRARVTELSSLALSKGIGPGKQLEAFLSLYGTNVRYDANHQLEVIQTVEGTVIPDGRTVDSLIEDALKEMPWLRPIVAAEVPRGSGSNLTPTRVTPPTEREAWRAKMLQKAGIRQG